MNQKYTKKIHDQIVQEIKKGGTQRAAALAVGLTPETLSIWKNKYPAFRSDIERAGAQAQLCAETMLFTMGKNGNDRALLHWLKRRCPLDWGDKQQFNDPYQWPDTLEGWSAKDLEFETEFCKWKTKYGIVNGPETSAPRI